MAKTKYVWWVGTYREREVEEEQDVLDRGGAKTHFGRSRRSLGSQKQIGLKTN